MTVAPPITNLCTHACTLLQREPTGPPDEYGDPTWQETETSTVCELQQAGSLEQDGVVEQSDWLLILPATIAPDGWDAIRVDSGPYAGTYELQGDARPVTSPLAAAVHHVEATVRRVR